MRDKVEDPTRSKTNVGQRFVHLWCGSARSVTEGKEVYRACRDEPVGFEVLRDTLRSPPEELKDNFRGAMPASVPRGLEQFDNVIQHIEKF